MRGFFVHDGTGNPSGHLHHTQRVVPLRQQLGFARLGRVQVVFLDVPVAADVLGDRGDLRGQVDVAAVQRAQQAVDGGEVLLDQAADFAVVIDDEDVVDILSERRLKGSYQFINPLLECDSSLGEKNIKLRNMEYLIKTYIDQVVRSGKVDTVAVYFRDLNNGPWMGINEDDEFAGASLLKLPLAMAVYKKSESNIGLLGTMVAYKEDKNSNNTQTFDLDMKLKLGKKYTLEELIERMLVNSDNEAKLLVEKFITGLFIIAILEKNIPM